jgi:hypothetical protein
MWMPVLPLTFGRLLSLIWTASRERQACASVCACERVWALPSGGVMGCTLRPGEQLQVQQGQLWLTCSGDARDHLLAAGQSWVAQGREQVMLEAVGAQACELRRAPAAPCEVALSALRDRGC